MIHAMQQSINLGNSLNLQMKKQWNSASSFPFDDQNLFFKSICRFMATKYVFAFGKTLDISSNYTSFSFINVVNEKLGKVAGTLVKRLEAYTVSMLDATALLLECDEHATNDIDMEIVIHSLFDGSPPSTKADEDKLRTLTDWAQHLNRKRQMKYLSKTLDTHLGSGTFGIVKGIDKQSAIKILDLQVNKSTMVTVELLRELVLWKTIPVHNNVLSLFLAWIDPDLKKAYIVFDRKVPLCGENGILKTLSQEQHHAFVVRACENLLDGVSHLHATNIVHRDIKPSNCLWDNRERCLMIADFGSCRRFANTDLQSLDRDSVRYFFCPTSFAYAAPETLLLTIENDEIERDLLCEVLWTELPFGQGKTTLDELDITVDEREMLLRMCHDDRFGRISMEIKDDRVFIWKNHDTPPPLRCSSYKNHITEKADVWSVGMVMVELYLNKKRPLSNSNEAVEVLENVYKIFGITKDFCEQARLNEFKGYAFFEKTKLWPYESVSAYIKTNSCGRSTDAAFCELMEKMFAYLPRERCSVESASTIFKEIFNPLR